MSGSFFWASPALAVEDFSRLACFCFAVMRKFLACERLFFVATGSESADLDSRRESWQAGISLVLERRRPAVDPENMRLYLPFINNDEVQAVVVLEGCAPELFQRSSVWLEERSAFFFNELALIKKWSLDPVSGLLNGRHLFERVVHQVASGPAGAPENDENGEAALLLIEVASRLRGGAAGFLQTVVKVADCLVQLVDPSIPLHHLGGGVFGLVWPQTDAEQTLKMGDAILRWLKRERFTKVHLGITTIGPLSAGQQGDCAETSTENIFSKAWGALKKAREKGPYGLCTDALPDKDDVHPLRLPPESLLEKFQQGWRGIPRFTVALIRQDEPGERLLSAREMKSLMEPDMVLAAHGKREMYLLLPGKDGAQALTWMAGWKKILLREKAATVSVGLAEYPCLDYSKTDLLLNARKALLHTQFYGSDTMTLFDGVSLNISGDIYYNEGDLLQAGREYRKGLQLDPDNINLLNSLGVAFAKQGRYSQAIPCFKKALTIDGSDFMVLFNLGFAYLTQGRVGEVIDCFERALSINDKHFDLFVQLGRLYCQAGRYQEAVEFFEGRRQLVGASRRTVYRSAVSRYFGEALQALGRNREAMQQLERAVRFNSRDAEALSMLGELYSIERQGDEIALSYCRQAVELDESNSVSWARLGIVQHNCGLAEDAAESLQKSLQLNRRNIMAMIPLARVYDDLGQFYKARRIFERVLRLQPGLPAAVDGLAALAGKAANQQPAEVVGETICNV